MSIVDSVSFSTELLRRVEGAERVGFIGSCVTRDLVHCMFPGIPYRDTFWRIGTPALVNMIPVSQKYRDAVPATDIRFFDRNFDKNYDLSAFFDVNDIVVIDQFRDVYGTFVLDNGAMFTDEIRVAKYDFKGLLNIDHKIDVYPKIFPDFWFDSAFKLANLVNQSDSFIILCPITAVNGVRDNNKYDNKFEWSPFQVRIINTISYYTSSILNLLIKNSVMLPRPVHFAEYDPDHEYGPGVIHLRPQYYDAMIAEFKLGLSVGVYDNRLDEERSLQMVNGLMKLWQADADCGYGFTRY